METNQTAQTQEAPVKKKKVFRGTVVSDKGDKSIVVEVSTKKKHPRYHKQIRWSKKYLVHDEKNEAKIGYVVDIEECRPYSKRKTFMLTQIVNKVEEVK